MAQRSIGQDHDRGVGADELRGRSYKQLIERLPILIAGFHRVLQVQKGLAVALDTGNNLFLRGKRNQRNLRRRDGPQVGLLLAEPVEEQRCAGLLSDLAGVQSRGMERGFALGHAQALRQRPGAAPVGRGQGLIAPALFDQEVDVVVVDRCGIGGERKSRVFVFELRPRRLEGGQSGFVHPLRGLGVPFTLKQSGQFMFGAQANRGLTCRVLLDGAEEVFGLRVLTTRRGELSLCQHQKRTQAIAAYALDRSCLIDIGACFLQLSGINSGKSKLLQTDKDFFFAIDPLGQIERLAVAECRACHVAFALAKVPYILEPFDFIADIAELFSALFRLKK